MDLGHILGLGVLQGLTDFLPISSSAHLILLPLLLGWEDQGLAFDVAVHVGTLIAVVVYFRLDLKRLINGWLNSVLRQEHTQDSRLAWFVVLGTVPVGIAGLMLGGFIELYLRSPIVIATTTIVFGLLLWWADSQGSRVREQEQLTVKDVVIIGFYQVLALVPGTSRSGITMTAGLLLGLTREAAARFSFLLSIPLIFLAGCLKTAELVASAQAVDWFSIILGVVFSALSAFLCITIFLKLLEKLGMLPFVLYRLILGVFLFYLFAL